MSPFEGAADCPCGSPSRPHATGPGPSNRYLPQAFGPAFHEEDRRYKLLQLQQRPFLLRRPDESFDFLDKDSRHHLELIHRFCNKTCALYYLNTPTQEARDQREMLLIQCYAAWFRHGKSNYRRGTNLIQEISLQDVPDVDTPVDSGETERLRRSVRLHEKLCDVVQSRMNNITLADKEREPEPGEEDLDEGTETSDHYLARNQFRFLPSFSKYFVLVDSLDPQTNSMVLVKLDADPPSDDVHWSHDVGARFSYYRGKPGQVLERLLRLAGLPMSEHRDIMHNGV